MRRKRENFTGHILRGSSLLNILFEGELGRKNCRGRPWMKYIGQRMAFLKSKSYVEMKRLYFSVSVTISVVILQKRRARSTCYEGCVSLLGSEEDLTELKLLASF
jgi:hypothetical protein